jgi:hypothetical protein
MERLDEMTSTWGTTANAGLRLRGSSRDGELGGRLEDVLRDNDGHQRSTMVSTRFRHDQRRRGDQRRLDAWSLASAFREVPVAGCF